MNKKSELVIELENIANNDYCLEEDKNVMDFALAMTKYIGNTDYYLRDDLIYSTFYYWIIEKNLFNHQNLILLLDTLIDDKHLFLNIGAEEDDTVLTRSFSMLIISLILSNNLKERFINRVLFNDITAKIILYYNKEIDLRGYDNIKKWIHSAAHGADAMCNIVLSDECDEHIAMQILDSIKNILNNGKHIFANEEDERIARIIINIEGKKLLSIDRLFEWFNHLVHTIDLKQNRENYIYRVNTKNLIRCLYFSFLNINSSSPIIDKLVEVEAKLNRFIQ